MNREENPHRRDDDDLDRRLFGAYGALDRRLEPRVPTSNVVPSDEQAQKRPRHISPVIVSVAALVAVVLVLVTIARRTDNPSQAVVTPAVSPPSTAAPTAIWYGFDPASTPDLTLWTAYETSPISTPDVLYVAELRTDTDWRSLPAASVVVLDTPYSTVDGSPPGSSVPNLSPEAATFPLDNGAKTVRIRSVGLSPQAVSDIAGGMRHSGASFGWNGLPANLQVTASSSPAQVPTTSGGYSYLAVGYALRSTTPAEVRISYTNDPVKIAEESIDRAANAAWSADSIADNPALGAGASDLRALWRDAGWMYDLDTIGPVTDAGVLARWHAALVPMSAGQRQLLHMQTAAIAADVRNLVLEPSPATQDRADRLGSSLPAAFEPVAGVAPPADQGAVFRWENAGTGEFVELAIAPPTSDASRSARVSVTNDDGATRTVVLEAADGWGYRMTVDAKGAVTYAPTTQEITDLLGALSQG